MRADPADYELVAPGSLLSVLALLAQSPGEWLPIAGGTDVMVLYAAGKLPARKLVSLWNLPELRNIAVTEKELTVGAACTYTDLRKHETVNREFPLLAQAARWTGGVANQNRGTLGGNIVNASPAADSLPALLVYEADLILVSARGERRVPYREFHTFYKKTLLAPDELIRDIRLPRRFAGYTSYVRKVGARNAQAIAKVCLAALGRICEGRVEEVHMAAGSVAPVPLRLGQTEQFVTGRPIDDSLLQQARDTAVGEIRPIDDIRSTASYRSAVLGNLVVEFLHKLAGHGAGMSEALARWNHLPAGEAAREILDCCGSMAWARELAERRPFADEESLFIASDDIWNRLPTESWEEAFSRHPRIGERGRPRTSSGRSVAWSSEEQQHAANSGHELQSVLEEANREYERRFGRIFIVCASAKSAAEILEILHRRLENDKATELRVAGEEQRKITNLRLQKWLAT